MAGEDDMTNTTRERLNWATAQNWANRINMAFVLFSVGRDEMGQEMMQRVIDEMQRNAPISNPSGIDLSKAGGEE